MKAIGNIHLIWRKGKGSERFDVGVIKRNALEGVRFVYNKDQVEQAKKYGFTLYEGFPDLDKVYTENVIEIFGQRLVKSERNDIDDFLNFWQIKRDFIKDKFYMLAYTQGLLPTDNFEFLAHFNPVKDLSFVSEIAGLSQTNVDSNLISLNDILTYDLQPTNPKDSYAVRVFKGGVFLGYIKLIHSRVFYASKTKLKLSVHNIESNGFLSRVFLKVSI